ncbi:hypothetical protein [Companilactobacillus furfuricola]|uniref:hypothetical protein n=1 Tax=Companilactobacillus furfuricola TaxID=1462575 RepID=UPI000F777F6A|nr:hypothetical protein [Companilactobacillus furfuricola]
MKLSKKLILLVFMVGTIVSAFFYQEITLNNRIEQRYYVNEFFTPVEFNKLSVNSRRGISSSDISQSVKKVSEQNKINIVFRNYIFTGASKDRDINQINDYSFNSGSHVFNIYGATPKYDKGKAVSQNFSDTFQFNLYNNVPVPNSRNGLILLDTTDSNKVQKIIQDLQMQINKDMNTKISTKDFVPNYKLPNPNLKSLSKFNQLVVVIMIFLAIAIVYWVIKSTKSILIMRTLGYSVFRIINQSFKNEIVYCTFFSIFFSTIFLAKKIDWTMMLIILLLAGLFYLIVLMNIKLICSLSFKIDFNRMITMGGYLLWVTKVIAVIIFVSMMSPFVKNSIEALRLDDSNNVYNNNHAVLFPRYIGQQTSDELNSLEMNREEIDSLKVTEKFGGIGFVEEPPGDSNGYTLLVGNTNWAKMNRLIDGGNRKIPRPGDGETYILFPEKLRSQTTEFLRRWKVSTNYKIFYIKRFQKIKDNMNQARSYVDPIIMIIGKNNYDKNEFSGLSLASNGGGIDSNETIPLNGKSLINLSIEMKKEFQKVGLANENASLVRLSKANSLQRKIIIGSMLEYIFELTFAILLIGLSGLVSFYLLFKSRKRKYSVKRINGYSWWKTYGVILIAPLIETVIILFFLRKILDVSIFIPTLTILVISQLSLIVLLAIQDKKIKKELFNEV